MLSRLTRGLRGRWARVLAVAYLCCALAPGLAFAFGDGVAARCALAGVHEAAMPQANERGVHAHHDHSGHQHGAAHAVADNDGVLDAALAQLAFMPQLPSSDVPSHHSDKADKMCCGLACLSALPAVFAAMTPPEFVASAQMSLPMQALVALTPARLYKPPIA